MNFLFNLLNHNLMGQRSLEDVIGIFGHQLRALGHGAVWNPDNKHFLGPGMGVNVVVEGFTDASIAKIAEHHAQGARFLCLATEEPTERGFNHGTQAEMVERQRRFPEAARYFDGILHLVPGEHVTSWYSHYAPTAYAELGYARTLLRQETVVEPEFDFGFYGSLSPRRLRILKRLASMSGRQKAVRVVADFKTQVERDRIMQTAKVLVQVRKFDQMGLVSSSRCNTALCIGRPVVAEPHALSASWDEVVKFAASEDAFYIEAIMARANWRAIHAGQMDRFRRLLSPEICVGHALDHIGLAEGRRAA